MKEQQSSGKTLNYHGKTMAGFQRSKSQIPVLFTACVDLASLEFLWATLFSPNLTSRRRCLALLLLLICFPILHNNTHTFH